MCQTHKWTFSSILRLYKTSLLHSQETILSHTSLSVCANSCLASCSTTSSWFFLVHFSFFCRKILWHNEPSMHPINATVSCTWVFYLKLSWRSFSRAFIFWRPEFLDKVRQSLSFNSLRSLLYLEKQRIVLFNSNGRSRHCKRFTNNSEFTMRIIPWFVFHAHVICDENVQTPVHKNQAKRCNICNVVLVVYIVFYFPKWIFFPLILFLV